MLPKPKAVVKRWFLHTVVYATAIGIIIGSIITQTVVMYDAIPNTSLFAIVGVSVLVVVYSGYRFYDMVQRYPTLNAEWGDA
jgi:hypothetical protein